MTHFNNQVRQVFFLFLLLALAITIFRQLYIFLPGFLGALTLYIMSRKWYWYLVDDRSWNKSLTAVLFISVFMICIALPVYFSFKMFYIKVEEILSNPGQIKQIFTSISKQLGQWTGMDFSIDKYTDDLKDRAAKLVPMLLSSSATMVGNLLMIMFLAFFMFVNGKRMEETVRAYVPLKKVNFDLLATETKMMVSANAGGLPLISLIQGLCGLIGFWIFGIKDYVLLGFVTGIFAFFPIVGTAVIWLPIVIYLFSTGENGKAIGLGIYSMIVTGNIDYVARVTFLKKVGDVHPLVTILGLIVGLKLFGFWGFIFGPLLISYFLLLMKIYKTEFNQRDT